MIGLARWCVQHRRGVVAGWLLALIVTLGLSQAIGGDFNSNFNLPNTDSAGGGVVADQATSRRHQARATRS